MFLWNECFFKTITLPVSFTQDLNLGLLGDSPVLTHPSAPSSYLFRLSGSFYSLFIRLCPLLVLHLHTWVSFSCLGEANLDTQVDQQICYMFRRDSGLTMQSTSFKSIWIQSKENAAMKKTMQLLCFSQPVWLLMRIYSRWVDGPMLLSLML